MSFDRNIVLLKWFSFFSSLNFLTPIAILYFAHQLHSFALAASIFSVTMIASAFSEIPTGILSDKIGRKQTMVLGTVVYILALFFYAWGTYIPILVGALFDGMSKAFYSGNNNALLHDFLSERGWEDKYDSYYAKLNTFLLTGLFISALLSGVVALWSYPLLVFLSLFFQFIALLICLLIGETRPLHGETSNIYNHLKDVLRVYRNNSQLQLLSLSEVLGYGMYMTAFSFRAAIYALFWPVWAVGIARSLGELAGIVSYHFSDKVIKRFGRGNTILFGSIYSWITNLLPSLFPSIITPFIIATSALLYGPADSAKQALFQKEFTDRQRATMGSLNSFLGSLWYSLFAFVMGWIADKHGVINAFIVIQLAFIFVIFLNWLLFKRLKKL